MADINIQRKKTSPSPWLLVVLAAVVLAVAAYFFLRPDPADESAPPTATPEAATPVAPPDTLEIRQPLSNRLTSFDAPIEGRALTDRARERATEKDCHGNQARDDPSTSRAPSRRSVGNRSDRGDQCNGHKDEQSEPAKLVCADHCRLNFRPFAKPESQEQ